MNEIFPQVRTETEYMPFDGGLDLVTPPLNIKPGHLVGSQNYIPDLNGGYRLAGMYERFDGRTAPSSAQIQVVACTITSTPAVGATVTIGAATGLFAQSVDGGCILTGVTGTIPTNTSMTVGGSPIGTTAANTNLVATTALQDATYRNAAAGVYRALIAAVPGSGPIRGVHIYKGDVYAFRDNAGGTACVMHKSTTSGWLAIELGEVVPFTNANVSVGDGDVLTQGAVTATIGRVFVETGSLASGSNTGRLFISGRAGGNFSGAAATSSGGGTLTLSGAQVAQSLPPGGRYEFDNYAFDGRATSVRMYGCNGIGPAFEFDGTTFATIDTKGTPNTPSFLKAHRNYLFLAQGSSIINSSVGSPWRFVTAEGASEIAVGDVVTGIKSLPGESLGIFCRNSSFQLTGASSSTWSLQVIRDDVGAVAYSTQTMSDTYMLDDRGITSVKQSDTYGNFATATLTRRVQPIINAARGLLVGSWVNRQRSLYSLMLSNGSAIVLGIRGEELVGITTLQYAFTPSCVTSGEDASGIERAFVGASDGFIYELDKGQSADGAVFEAFIRLAYNSSRSPRVRKRYRKMVLQMVSDGYTELNFSAELAYGAPDISPLVTHQSFAQVGGGLWGSVDWNTFYWDAQDIYEPEIPLSGTGTNLSITFYKNNALDSGHVLQGGVIHYTPRRLQR